MKKIYVDALVLTLSVALAVYIAKAGLVHQMLEFFGDGIIASSFVAGLFFTSFFTTPPAIAVLGSLAQEGNLFVVALVGGLGAVVGDYFLFMFVRDRVVSDTEALMKGPRWRRFLRLMKRSHFRRVLPFLGALIIASPFPDEVGLTLLGISKIKTRQFLMISYVMNTLGILAIGLAARSLS